jgi:hypothetical protein
MNEDKLERRLINAARANPPSDAVPYAFEQRVFARITLASTPGVDMWSAWSRALWRAAAPCVAIAVILGVWTAVSSDNNAAATDFSQALENTLFVSVTQDSNSTW